MFLLKLSLAPAISLNDEYFQYKQTDTRSETLRSSAVVSRIGMTTDTIQGDFKGIPTNI